MSASDEDSNIRSTTSSTTSSSTIPIANRAASYGTINSVNTSNIEGTSSEVHIPIEESENTPLLRKLYDVNNCEWKPENLKKKPKCIDFSTIAFLALISSSLTVASYLLWEESKEPEIGFALNLVHHDIWSTLTLPTEALLDHNKVHNVLITHTGDESCTLKHRCRNVLKKIQKQHNSFDELHYNFLIGGDGQTYEARGWDYQSGCKELPQETSLVVAFLGNYTQKSPSITQLKSAFSLIWESVKRKRLLPSYQIYALRNASKSVNDGGGFFKEIIHWPNYMGMLQFT